MPARPHGRLQVIHGAGAASIAFLAAGIWLYGPTIVKLAYDWWTNPDYSHGLVVLPLGAALVCGWRRAGWAVTAAAAFAPCLARRTRCW